MGGDERQVDVVVHGDVLSMQLLFGEDRVCVY